MPFLLRGLTSIESGSGGIWFSPPPSRLSSEAPSCTQEKEPAFETNRDNSYGVAKNRQDVTTIRAPKLIRDENGVAAGGPIFLPYFWGGPRLYDGMNRSFFFVAFEKLSLRQAASQNLYVPTDAMRSGNFSGLTNANGQIITLYDPATTALNSACPTPSGSTNNNQYC